MCCGSGKEYIIRQYGCAVLFCFVPEYPLSRTRELFVVWYVSNYVDFGR